MSPYTIYSTTQSAWDAMYAAIQAAERSIYWEVYIFIDDKAGKPFFDLLEAKARQEVEVKLILDALGSFRVSGERIASLKAAGVDVLFFSGKGRKQNSWWRRLYSRTHRKILIIDNKVGFLGGVNVEQRMADWLDIHLRVEGRVVHSLLRSFAKAYVTAGGRRADVRHLRRLAIIRGRHTKKDGAGDSVEFISDVPDKHVSYTRKKYTDAIRRARRHIILFTPYYFPDRFFLRALWQARERGVRIDLIIPFRTDVRLATYAAYACFSVLRRYGVRIHFLRRMMHGKGMVVDDELAIVGTSNLDQTSFYDNYEANLKIRDRRVVRRLRAIVTGWMQTAETLEDVQWEKRPLLQRFKERIAYMLYRLWHRR